MKKLMLILLFVFYCMLGNILFAEVNPENIQRLSLNSKILDENREMYVYLPEGYQGSYSSYPVIYIMDGEKYFTMAVEIIDFMIENHSIPPHIVVGLVNSNAIRDMTPKAPSMHKKIFPMRGGANRFAEALQKEIIPHINYKYRTRPQNLMIGHDFSGLFGLHLLINRPEMFDRYLVFSPNLWWDNRSIVNKFEEEITQKLTFNKSLYMSIGVEGKQLLLACEEFVRLLKHNTPNDFDWNFEWLADETHYSLVKQSVISGLEKVFDDYQYPNESDLEVGGFAVYQSYKGKVLLNYGEEVKVPYTLLQSVGYTFLNRGNATEALKFFREGIKIYPQNAEALFHLGKVYEKMNNLPQALFYMEKAYQIAPGRKDFEVSLFNVRKPLRDSISQ